MTRILRALALAAALLAPSIAAAQTSPNWSYGFVPTPAQWNAQWASKQDYLGAPPLLTTGGTMLGKLVTAAPTASRAGLNLPPGTAPSSPIDGDLWTTTSAIFARINGATVNLLTPSAPCPTCAVTNATNTFTSNQIVNVNGGATPAAQTNMVLQLVGANAASARLEVDTFAGTAFFTGVRANGTLASPTTLVAGNGIVALNAWGYDGTSRVGPYAAIQLESDGTWTSTSHPTLINFFTTDSTASALVTSRMKIERDGGLTLNGATSRGLGTINSQISSNVSFEYRLTNSIGSGGTNATAQFTAVSDTGFVAVGASSSFFTGTTVPPGVGFVFGTNGLAYSVSSGKTQDFYLNNVRTAGITSGGAFQIVNSLAIAGCTIGSDVLCATGSASVSGALASGAHAITSNSANALVAGLNGATNPAFKVNASTGSSVTGVEIVSGVSGASAIIRAISSATNENFAIDAKAAGSLLLSPNSTGTVVSYRAFQFGHASTAAGQAVFVNTVSGSINILTPAGALGTVNINLPTAGGTFGVAGTGGISVTSAGVITCSTCLLNTPAALTKTDDTNVTLTLGGTPTTALLQAVSLTLGWTGNLSVARGGSGAGTFTANAFLTGNGTSAFAAVAITGLVLGNGASAPSAYAGTSCTNQFVRSLSAAGVATCNSVAISTDVSGLGTGVASALSNALGTANAVSQLIATGTIALNTTAVTNGTCGTVQTASANGTAATDVIDATFNADPSAVTGYTAPNMLTFLIYPTTNTVNVKVCNNTGSSITPGAVTLNWKVRR